MVQLLIERERSEQVSRCMWCGKTNIELNHQYILPICDNCKNEFNNK